jgi:hypothetical protein
LRARLWILVAVLIPLILLAAPSSIIPRVQACDASGYYLSAQAFLVDILQLSTDKPSYQPGDTVVIIGTVRLVEQDTYSQSGCPDTQQIISDNPDAVGVGLTSSFKNENTAASADGGFSFTFALDSSTKAGTYSFTVYADCPQCANLGPVQAASQDGSFQVSAYTPTLSVIYNSGYPAYPGDKITVHGAGWAPTDPITMNWAAEGTVTVSGPTFDYEIEVIGFKEGPNTILASQGSPPYLTKTTQFDVKWHTLVITAAFTPDMPTVVQGTAITITGVVTTDDGKPQPGIQVNAQAGSIDLLPVPQQSSDPSGKFTITLDTKAATPQTYDIVLTTTNGKDNSFHDATPLSLSLTVTAPPPTPAAPAATGAVVGGLGGLLGAAAAFVWAEIKGVAKTPPLAGEAVDVLEEIAQHPKESIDGARALTHLGGQKDYSFQNALDDM